MSSDDCMYTELKQVASKAVGHGRKDELVRELQAQVADLQRQLAAAAPAPAAPPAAPPSAPPAAPPADPDPAPPPLREYKSLSSKVRAARRLRKLLCEYPEDAHADWIARVIVVDGRGKKRRSVVSLWG